MKKLVLVMTCGIFIFNTANAQKETEKEREIKHMMWGSPAKEFKAMQVPDKWKNESAVLLAVDRDLSYETTKAGYGESFTMHYRIKLLDKAAVNKFSELSFNNNSVKTNWFGKTLKYRILGIKVIKPNGKENILDMKDAVKDDAGSSKELKIPVPNLEPGDIIDYFAASKDDYGPSTISDEELLENDYPVVKQTLRFHLYDKLELAFKSYNGAPEFKASKEDKCNVYTLEDNMREKMPAILWDFPYRTAPGFRYYLTKKSWKKDIKKDAVYKLNDYESATSSAYKKIYDIGFMKDYIRGNFHREKDPKLLTYELYYLLRNPIYISTFYNIPQGEPLKVDHMPTLFFIYMIRCLDECEVSFDLLMGPSRTMGAFPDLVDLNSTDLVIRVNTTPAIYISRPTPFSTPDEIDYRLEGVEAAILPTKAKPSRDSLAKISISSMEDNLTATDIKIAIKEGDMTKLNVQRSILAKGNAKDYHQGLVVTDYDYLKAYDLPKYQEESSHLMGRAIKDYNKEKVKFEQRATTDYNERDKKVKAEIESDMDVKIADYKLNLKSIGMWHTDPGTQYDESFTVESITKKAGPNMIIELGKLIEKQVEVKDEQLKRSRDVYMAYPRLFTYDLTFAIPSGYAVDGLENFNMKVVNAAGGFESVAKIEGKNIVIHAKKYYVKNYYPAIDWDKITAFTQSANNFYNAKILLKKAP